MPADDGHDIVIISDLHMSAGRDDCTGTFDRNEDFFYDGAFGRFIDYLIERAQAKERRLRLVILGDFVDFLQVDPEKASGHEIGDTSSESTLAKLEIISRGHKTVFRALGNFIKEGHLLDIVLGNHDVEFVWSDVQNRFREVVSRYAGSDVGDSIAFHRWIFYVPGVVYADHGHQYDARNSFINPSAPSCPQKTRRSSCHWAPSSCFTCSTRSNGAILLQTTLSRPRSTLSGRCATIRSRLSRHSSCTLTFPVG